MMVQGRKKQFVWCGLLVMIAFLSYSVYSKKLMIFGKVQQEEMTPQQVLQDLIAGNKRFYSNSAKVRQSLVAKSQKASAQGQFPKAVILACMDSRSIPEIIFDQTVGDIFTLRVAGNVVNTDMLASLEYATYYSGSKVIVIMGHTGCGAIQAACAGGVEGNVQSLVATIKPAVAQVQKNYVQMPLDCNDGQVLTAIAWQNVRNMVAHVVALSPIIASMHAQGAIKIVGALHDLDTGVVTFEEPL